MAKEVLAHWLLGGRQVKIRRIKNPRALWLIATVVFLPPALAATPAEPITSESDVINALGNVAGFMFNVFLGLAVIFVIFAAFLYLTATGDTNRLNQAKNVLIYSIVAIVIALLAGGVTTLVQNIIGVKNVVNSPFEQQNSQSGGSSPAPPTNPILLVK
jgi:hypothetical protein